MNNKMNKPLLSIIFNTYIKNIEWSKLFLNSIKRNTFNQYEVIAVVKDKNLMAGFRGLVDKIIYAENSLGYGFSMNRGSEIAEGKYLAFVNDDIIFGKYWDKKLIEELNKDLVAVSPDSGMVENCGNFEAKFTEFDTIYDKIIGGTPLGELRDELNFTYENFDKYIGNIKCNKRVVGFSGDCIIVRRDVFDKIKWSENLLFGENDWDYFLKLVDGGFPPIRIVYGSYVYHPKHERQWDGKAPNLIGNKDGRWPMQKVVNLMPDYYWKSLATVKEMEKKKLPKVLYAAGVYIGSFKRQTDMNVAVLLKEDMLAGFIKSRGPKDGDLFPPVNSEDVIKSDIFHGNLHKCLAAMKRARELNPKVKLILQCDSAHPTFIKKIMCDEYDELKIDGPWTKMDNGVMLQEIEMTDIILVASTFSAEKYMENGMSKSKIKIIPHPIQTDLFPFMPYQEKDFYVFYCGGGDYLRKGLFYVVEAIKQLKNEGCKVELLTSLGGDAKEVMMDKFRKAAVCVLPSLEDGFPASVREGMLIGRPAIVSINTGVRDIIENYENGFIVPTKDIQSIKEKVVYFYKNRNEIIRMGLNARRTILSYTIDDYQKRLIDFYKGIINE